MCFLFVQGIINYVNITILKQRQYKFLVQFIFSPSIPIAGHRPPLFYVIMFNRPSCSSTSPRRHMSLDHCPMGLEILHPKLGTILSLSCSIYHNFALLSVQVSSISNQLSYLTNICDFCLASNLGIVSNNEYN